MLNNSQKGFTISMAVIIIAVAIVAGGVFYSITKQPPTTDEIDRKAAIKEKNDITDEAGEDEFTDETPVKYSGIVLAGQSSPLLDFSKADYDKAIKAVKLVVLYFCTDSSQDCVAEFPIMQASFNKLDVNDVVGFRVNYNDEQTDIDEENLAKKFNVISTNTKVFIKKGSEVLKSPDKWSNIRYDMEISRALLKYQ